MGGGGEPVLTQLMMALVGTSPRNGACGVSLEQGHPILLCRSGLSHVLAWREAAAPWEMAGGGLPWGCWAAGELMCLPGRWKRGGEGHSSIRS